MSTSKRFEPNLSINQGDKVIVIAGSHNGETGEVEQVFPNENRAFVEG